MKYDFDHWDKTEMTREEALDWFESELEFADGKRCFPTCPQCQAEEWAVKALKEPSRIERELHGKTPEEQLDFLEWFIKDYATTFTNTRQGLIEWLKGENL